LDHSSAIDRRPADQSLRLRAWSGGKLLRCLDFGGVNEHDWNVVLNGVNTATLAAFEARVVVDQGDRLLADRANEHVEEILRNHDAFIVAPN
jgi:hypothetical protein